MLGVGNGVADDILQEDLEHTTRLLVDETGNTFDTATTSKATDSLRGGYYNMSVASCGRIQYYLQAW